MDNKNFNALFTKESLLSLQGGTTAALLVPNVLTYLIGSSFQPYEKWVALAIAMIISLVVAWTSKTKGALAWIIAVLNGFLVFASAAGLTDALGSSGSGLSQSISFFHSWF